MPVGRPAQRDEHGLSEFERAVLQGKLDGKTAAEIAVVLAYSPKTVAECLSKTRARFRCRSTYALIHKMIVAGRVTAVNLVFHVEGPVASVNRVTRHGGGAGIYKNPVSVAYQKRVAQAAWVAARAEKWQTPEAVAVTIFAYNTRLDADNVPKAILDGMSGVVYGDDKCVVALSVFKRRDGGPERVEIHVCEAMPLIGSREVAKLRRIAAKGTARHASKPRSRWP